MSTSNRFKVLPGFAPPQLERCSHRAYTCIGHSTTTPIVRCDACGKETVAMGMTMRRGQKRSAEAFSE